MFYRLLDPQHPRYDAALAQRFGDTILREYERMDTTIGDVLARMRPDDTLIVLSDHGFHNYRRGLHVNQWLRSQGWLNLKGGASSAEREFLLDVDWSRTRAYAVGTGQIYLNVRGRERDGIVSPEDVAALTDQIKARLLQLRDRDRRDAVVVSHAYAAAEAFRGKRAEEAPDIQIGFAENYRTSWETILGGVPDGLFADNDKKWSGDHAASDFADTPGFILANRVIDKQDPHIVDIAPTTHALFQRPIPSHYAGKPLFAAPGQ
jgi:predicted AlkP superfamily phosphohydrolase/phosphomutase